MKFRDSNAVRNLSGLAVYVPLVGLLVFALNLTASAAEENAVATGKTVALRYIVSLPDGTVVHSNMEGHPIRYTQGDGKLLPALDAELVGLRAGETKTVTLESDQVYGGVNEDAFQEVAIEQVPAEYRQVDAVFRAQGFPGSIRVAEVRENTVLLDYNHPLAGKTLTYDVTIVSVE
ncbi:MAG: FKBP-type peptidyl-prolyl cis-trans isomerase [Woeseiaceae bacterium]